MELLFERLEINERMSLPSEGEERQRVVKLNYVFVSGAVASRG